MGSMRRLTEKVSGEGGGPAGQSDVSSVPVNTAAVAISFIVVFWGETDGEEVLGSVIGVGIKLYNMKSKKNMAKEGRGALKDPGHRYKTVRWHAQWSGWSWVHNTRAARIRSYCVCAVSSPPTMGEL